LLDKLINCLLYFAAPDRMAVFRSAQTTAAIVLSIPMGALARERCLMDNWRAAATCCSGIEGSDVVVENLRQLCIGNFVNATGQSWKWWCAQ